MITKHICKEELKSSNWSGGTTTELYIYPETGSYQDRNFLMRLSTATIDKDFSKFTILPGVKRKLMILEGQVKIDHPGRYSKVLNKFETDDFMGNWDTLSYGKSIDFNVMIKNDWESELEVVTKPKCICVEDENHGLKCIFLYLFKGKAEIICGDEIINMNAGDFLVGTRLLEGDKVKINASVDFELVEVRVK